MQPTMGISCILAAWLCYHVLAGPGQQVAAQTSQQQASLEEGVSEEALLFDCEVDGDGFVGTEWAMAPWM